MTKPSYAILRVAKIHTRRQLRAAAEHNDRTADRGLEHTEGTPADNIPIIGDPDVLATWDAKMEAKGLDPAKQRKDGVMALEWVASASPEFFRTATLEQRTRWAAESVAFIQEQAGGADNVLAIYLHDDEQTPHIHALTIPLVEKERKAKGRPRKGRTAPQKAAGPSWGLSAADLIGGSKDRLSALQDAYAEAVAGTGLQRGIRRKETGVRNLSPAQFRARSARVLDSMEGEAQGLAQDLAQSRAEAAQGLAWLRDVGTAVKRDAAAVGVAVGFPGYAGDPKAEPARAAVKALLDGRAEAAARARTEEAARQLAAMAQSLPAPLKQPQRRAPDPAPILSQQRRRKHDDDQR